ncbi:MAG: hypothetical protein U0L11_04090 [Acutalibacteraceae bacterium]|nr:hypothetical protein [Acutalibacteraceae bacterium]
MARYIDADEFIKYEIKKNGCVPRIDGGGYNLDRLDDEVNNFPAADVQEIRHGKWIEKPYLFSTSNFCSLCGENYGMPHGKFNYCPNCGAKMDGKEDEE